MSSAATSPPSVDKVDGFSRKSVRKVKQKRSQSSSQFRSQGKPIELTPLPLLKGKASELGRPLVVGGSFVVYRMVNWWLDVLKSTKCVCKFIFSLARRQGLFSLCPVHIVYNSAGLDHCVVLMYLSL